MFFHPPYFDKQKNKKKNSNINTGLTYLSDKMMYATSNFFFFNSPAMFLICYLDLIPERVMCMLLSWDIVHHIKFFYLPFGYGLLIFLEVDFKEFIPYILCMECCVCNLSSMNQVRMLTMIFCSPSISVKRKSDPLSFWQIVNLTQDQPKLCCQHNLKNESEKFMECMKPISMNFCNSFFFMLVVGIWE